VSLGRRLSKVVIVAVIMLERKRRERGMKASERWIESEIKKIRDFMKELGS
jgi:hypothetical protein